MSGRGAPGRPRPLRIDRLPALGYNLDTVIAFTSNTFGTDRSQAMHTITLRPPAEGGENHLSVYEVIRITNGRPQFLPEHFERLKNSLRSIGRTVPFSCEDLAEAIRQLAEDLDSSDHNVRLEVDVKDDSYLFPSATWYPSEYQYEHGVPVGLFDGERKNPHLKILDYALRAATDEAIEERDLYEVLLVDRYGNITEGSRSNVFFIKKGEVYTSPLHQVLPGITRGKIIEIISGKGKAVHEEPIPTDEIDAFDSAFICGTSPKVLPIATIEDVAYDVDDPLLREIMAWYDEAVLSDE